MRKIFFWIGLLTVLLFRINAYAFGGCEEDCQKCHALEKNEAQQILTKIKAADAKVVDIKMSPIKGLWEVVVEDKGARGVIYVGFSKKYIVKGSIYEVETASNKTRETVREINRPVERYVDVSRIPLDGALLVGDKNAEYKVVVFTDPDCPFCSRLHNELKKIISERKDIAFYLKLMPLKFHPDAYWKSQTMICSLLSGQPEKALRMLEDNFEKRPVPRPECETKAMDDNIKLGGELGITGTPTLVMPDGLVVVGAKDAKAITELVLTPRRKDTSK